MRRTLPTRPAGDALTDPRSIAVRTLLIDRTARRVLDAFRAAEIPSVVLKGLTTARWLYEPGERNYVDLDVLVRAEDAEAVDAVLHRLGYVYPLKGASKYEVDDHSWTYEPMPNHDRQLFCEVDVHFTLPGVRAPHALVWRELERRTVQLELAGGVATGLNEAGRALVLVLHAARDGRRKQQSYEDLLRLVARLPRESWSEVAELARRLEALEPFAGGLLLLDDGPERLTELGVPAPSELQTLLYRRDIPVTARRVDQLVRTAGPVAKMKLAFGELWPTTRWLKWWAAQEGLDPEHVPTLRLRRILRVARATPQAVSSWRRMRIAAGNRPQTGSAASPAARP